MKKVIFILTAVFGLGDFAGSQILNEDLAPKLPYPGVSGEVVAAPHGFYVSGFSSAQTSYFDGISGTAIPFILFHPDSPQKTFALIPDTARSLSYAFSSNYDMVAMSSVVTSNDSFFVAWSKMKRLNSDVPPTLYMVPTASLGKYRNGKIEKILSLENGVNPSMLVDNSNTLHFVWERVTPGPSPDRSTFSTYSSTILYRSRNQFGQLSDTLVIGRGFFPKIASSQNALHIVYFQADSTQNALHIVYFQADSTTQSSIRLVYQKISAGVATAPVVLWEINGAQTSWLGHIPSGGWLNLFALGADSVGGVHAGWRSTYNPQRFFVLHYLFAKGVQVDSSDVFYNIFPKFRFMPDGEVRVFAVTQNSYNDVARLRYILSKQGTALNEAQVIQLVSSGSLAKQVVVDRSGRQHALVVDYTVPPRTYLFKNIGTTDTSRSLLTSAYTVGSSAYVDTATRVWLTGTRDSTFVILNFSVDDVGKADDFSFPLNAGNRWYYRVDYIEGDPINSFRGYDSVFVDNDTVATNGKRYTRLSSKRYGVQLLRKDGFKVFQYSLKDSDENLRFNFAAKKGDTVAVYGKTVVPQYSLLIDVGTKYLFGQNRNSQRYMGHPPGSRAFDTEVADGFGIVFETDGLTESSTLVAAKIGGITYGTIPVADFYFPLKVGNEWYYQTYAEPPGDFPPSLSTVSATHDTLMPNGKRYIELASRFFGSVYWRREGSSVFQFMEDDSTEFTRFNFAKASRETIATVRVDGQWRSIVIDTIYTRRVLNRNLRNYRFHGEILSSRFRLLDVDVSDSLGVTHFGLTGPETFLIGAKIDGKEYGVILSVPNDGDHMPRQFSLAQNYPNPFNPVTYLRFTISNLQFVRLKIFDVLAREVAVMVNERKEPGNYEVRWDASCFSSGVYFYQLRAGSFVETKKMLLMK